MFSAFRHFARTGIPSCSRGITTNLTRAPSQNQTIYALSTPPGKGGVAVVRVSGPDVEAVWKNVVRPVSKTLSKQRAGLPRSNYLYRCHVVDSEGSEEILDDGLAVFFQGAPKSFFLSTSI